MAKKRVKRDTLGTINHVLAITKTLFSLLFLVIIGFFFIGILASLIMPESSLGGNVALIPITGKIVVKGDDMFSASGTKSDKIVKWIGDADKDESIKAIVLDINSGGGSPVASEEISQALKDTDKPVIAVIREIGASGAFWIATAADKIYVNRMSITGSIGVIGSHLEFAGFLDNYNITYRRLVAGKFKDSSSPFKEMSPLEMMKFQQKLDKLHSYFIEAVANNRGLEVSDVKEVADGFIMLGSEAIEKGLADEVGGLKEAKSYLKQELNEDISFRKYKEKTGLFQMFDTASSHSSYAIGQGLGDALSDQELSIET